LGFNDSINLSNLNVTKFVLNFNEKFILDNIIDLTKNGNIEKLTDFKPSNIDNCSSTIQKQLDGLKYNDYADCNYGVVALHRYLHHLPPLYKALLPT
jgi:hypothetical protein